MPWLGTGIANVVGLNQVMIILYQRKLVNTHVFMKEAVCVVNVVMTVKHCELKYNRSREDNSDELWTMQQI